MITITQNKDIEDVLVEIGSPGRFHIFMCFILFSLNGFLGTQHVSLMTTYGITPQHKCQQHFSSASQNWSDPRNSSIQSTGNMSVEYTQCSMIERYITPDGVKVKKLDCKGPWKYQQGSKTIVTQWDLVCSMKYLPSVASVLYFIGVMVGGFVWGILSDRYGRRPILLTCFGAGTLLSIVTAFSPYFSVFCALRTVQGFLNGGIHSILYIIPAESTARKYYNITAVSLLNSFIISVAFGFSVALVLKDWKLIQLAVSVPSVLVFVFAYRYLPESTRWLILRGRQDEIVKSLERMATFNGVNVPGIKGAVQLSCEKKTKLSVPSGGILDIVKNRELRKRTILIAYLWLAAGITYYGLSVNLGTLNDDPYLTTMIGSLTDIPAFLMAFWYVRLFGKRRPCVILFTLGGLACLSFIFYKSTVVIILGKGLQAVCFGLLFLFVPELYPTVIRNVGVGICVVFSRLGSVLAPQIVLLGLYTSSYVPMVILGGMGVVAGINMIFLPETHNQRLPDTIEDIEQAGCKNHPGNKTTDILELQITT